MVIRAGAQTGSEKNGRAVGQMVGRSVGESLESVSKVDRAGLSVGRFGRSDASLGKRRAVGAVERYVVCLFDECISIYIF